MNFGRTTAQPRPDDSGRGWGWNCGLAARLFFKQPRASQPSNFAGYDGSLSPTGGARARSLMAVIIGEPGLINVTVWKSVA